MDLNDIKNKLVEEKDKVEQGLGKVGDAAKAKFGHDDQIDGATKKANEYLDNEAAKRESGPTA